MNPMNQQEPMIEVSPTIRVEKGPLRKRAVATDAKRADKSGLLEMAPDLDEQGKADPTKQTRHAKLPDGTVLARHYKLGFADALGFEIEAGKEFTYLDWMGGWGWYVYQLQDVGVTAKGEIIMPDSPHILKGRYDTADRKAVKTQPRWITVGIFAGRDEALIAAGELKGKE